MEVLLVYLLGLLFFGLLALFVVLVLTRYTDKTEAAQALNKEAKEGEATTVTEIKTGSEERPEAESLPTPSKID